MAPQVNHGELAKSKEDLTSHFIEEVKVKKRIHELEQKMESATMTLMSKRNELAKAKDSLPGKLI